MLSVDEVIALLSRPLEGDDGDPLLQLRDVALIELMYGAGLRVSELTGLDLLSVDLSERLVRVRGVRKAELFPAEGIARLTVTRGMLDEQAVLDCLGVQPGGAARAGQ